MNVLRYCYLLGSLLLVTGIRAQGHHHHSEPKKNMFLKMMDTMMVSMDAVPLTGILERDFLMQMIPHHEGAIAMAGYQVQYGSNPEMLQLAKSILSEQKGEILDMKAMLKGYPEASDSLNRAFNQAMIDIMKKMMKHTPADSKLPASVDCCFAMIMLPHHIAAVDMAKELIRFKPTGTVAVYVHRIIGDQQVEIEQMQQYIEKFCKH